MKTIKDLVGQQFGQLTVLKLAPQRGRRIYWLCECKCGVVKEYLSDNLRGNKSLSCGCLRAAANIARTKHGGCELPEYGAWRGMKARCTNQNVEDYPIYGGRGIKVCPEWENDFAQFYKDMGPKPTAAHSLDRKDSNGNYEPANCKWSTPFEQANNRRIETKFTRLTKED